MSNPLLVLQKLREVSQTYLVADVRMSGQDRPLLELIAEKTADPRSGVDLGLGLRPSRSGLELMLTHSGFTDVKEIPPKAPLQKHYFDGRRSLYTARVAHYAGSGR